MFFIFQEIELPSSKIEKFVIFLEMELSYILGRKFLSFKNKKNGSEKVSYIFSKKVFLIFRETEHSCIF